MATILFDQIVFGPVLSRRLGVSLGVNLLPRDGKICNFDCCYCECGLNNKNKSTTGIPTQQEVIEALERKLSQMKEAHKPLDVITFAGNGEPTLHPQFAEIIVQTCQLRDQHYPNAKVSVLSNATKLDNSAIFEALLKVDNNIQKLDSVYTQTVTLLNRPVYGVYSIEQRIEWLRRFEGQVIVQTLLIRARDVETGNILFDNTTPEELSGLLAAVEQIAPYEVMLYTIDRETPMSGLEKLTALELEQIANLFTERGIRVQISY